MPDICPARAVVSQSRASWQWNHPAVAPSASRSASRVAAIPHSAERTPPPAPAPSPARLCTCGADTITRQPTEERPASAVKRGYLSQWLFA